MKVSIYIFALSLLVAGSLFAQESVASSLRISTAARTVTINDRSEAIIREASSESVGHASSIDSREEPATRGDRPKTSDSVAQSFHLDYDNRNERAIDERVIDRLGLFDHPDDSGSGRYNASLELENEDGDWSFEVTFTVEF